MNALNVFKGPDAMKDYYNPDMAPCLPLVEIPRSVNPFYDDGVRVYAKMMTMHPANNVKAIPVTNMLEKSIVPGKTKTIIEYSSGSTVTSMALIAKAVYGISDTRAFLSNKMTKERIKLMRFYGLDITLFGGPGQPEPDDPRGGIQAAKSAAENFDTVVNPNQYDNHDNWKAHSRWTAPQILKQLPEINVICASLGTAGTVTGLGMYFKEAKPSVLRVGVGTAAGDWVPGPRPVALLAPVDFPWKESVDVVEEVGSYDSFSTSLDLCREGLLCGPSSGFNLKGLYQMLERKKKEGRLGEIAGPDGLIHCAFICCDLPYQYIDEYFKRLEEHRFKPIRNERLQNVDPYPYEDTWERVPLDAINDYYYISGSLLERLGPGTVIKEGCLVLDLRQPFDFTAWHLPGAINFPLRSLRSSTTSPFKDPNILEEQWLELEETFRDASVLSKLHDYRVLLVCYDGDTSRVATSVLQAKGVSAENIRGGYGAITELVRKEVGIHDQLRRDLILPVEKAMIITTETELVTSEGTG